MIIDDNGNYYRIPTEWMQKHDARIRADALEEVEDNLSTYAFGKRNGLIHMDDVRKVLGQMKEKNNECN